MNTDLQPTLTDFQRAIESDMHALIDVLRTDPDASVPTCPGWNVSRLAGHTSRVHRMATRVVEMQHAAPPASSDLAPVPTDAGDLVTYCTTGLSDLLSTLREADPQRPAWNMTGNNQHAGFWSRRMAHETYVHTVDAQLAAGIALTQRSTALAIDGVDEFFVMFARKVRMAHEGVSLSGTVHFHATDAHGEWMVRVTNGVLTVSKEHGKGSAAVRGTADQLMLGLWNRLALDGDQFEHFGEASAVSDWIALGGI